MWIIHVVDKPRPPFHNPYIHKINPLPPENLEDAWAWINQKYPLKHLRQYPPHILIVGEAPGESENLHGQPFYGIAGHILRTTFSWSMSTFLATITNTVCCRPVHTPETTTDEKKWRQNRQPEKSEQDLCKPHFTQLLESYQFDGLMILGEVADEYVKQFSLNLPTLKLYHPAYIARLNYKLLTIKEEAKKIELWVKTLRTGKSCLGRF